jgi:hypothetical protein
MLLVELRVCVLVSETIVFFTIHSLYQFFMFLIWTPLIRLRDLENIYQNYQYPLMHFQRLRCDQRSCVRLRCISLVHIISL